MRTGRPAKKETPYKIIVHTNGGRRYASTKITIVREDGSKQSRHKHWGTVDDNNRFHPNTTYFNASPQERASSSFHRIGFLKRPRDEARLNAGELSIPRMM